MLDDKFCDFLEYRICHLIETSNNVALKGYWCDGVLLPAFEHYYSQKSVNDNRQVTLKAYIGKDGQQEFELVLYFGPKSLSRYSRGLDISPCIPDTGDTHFEIDVENLKAELQLL